MLDLNEYQDKNKEIEWIIYGKLSDVKTGAKRKYCILLNELLFQTILGKVECYLYVSQRREY